MPPVKTLNLTSNSTDKKLAQSYLKADQAADYIHPDLRWYVNTGTFRRSIGVDFLDYAELAGYDPSPIGYAVAEIRDRELVNVRLVEV